MTPNLPASNRDMNSTRQRGFSDQPPASLLSSSSVRNNINKECNNNNNNIILTSPNVQLLNNNNLEIFNNNSNNELLSTHQQSGDPRRRSVSDSSIPNTSLNITTMINNDHINADIKFYPPTSPSSSTTTNHLLFNNNVPPPPIVISPSITEPKQQPHSSADEWLVIPILIVSSLPKEVDQLLRNYTSGKHLKKQAPPCCVSHHAEGNKSLSHKNKLKLALNNGLNTATNQIPWDYKSQLATSELTQQQTAIAMGDMSQQQQYMSPESNEQKQPKIPLVYNNYLSPRSSHSRTSTSSNNSSSPNTEEDGQTKPQRDVSPPGSHHHNKHHSSGRPKHHHHKSNSGNLGVSFQIPQQNLAVVSRSGSRKNVQASASSTNEDSISGIQNIQHHIQQQLHLQDTAIAVPPQQQNGATTGKKIIQPIAQPKSKILDQDSNKLNYYLRKNKRVTEWYIEEQSFDYLRHLDVFFEKNEVSQLSSISHDLLNTGFHLEDLISIDEEDFFETYLEKSISQVPEKKKIIFRVCHTGSRHALSLRQALYKQMLLEQKQEQNQTIAPTVVIFVFSYTNSSCSLENTAMTWMKEINSIYPTFFSQGNFMLAGHIELNKSTKQQIALLRRNVEDATANVGLVQKPKHYYHFHQKAVPLFQNKKNQRLNIVEFDTRLGTNISQIFFEAYRLYCLDFFRKSIVNALTIKSPSPQIPSIPPHHSGSPNEAANHHDSQSPPLHTSTPPAENKSLPDDTKKKKDNLNVETTEFPSHISPQFASPHTHHDEDHSKEETKTGLISPTNPILPPKQESTKTEKTALSLGLLKIFKKTKKEETQVKKPTVEKLLKNQKKKKKKEEDIFRWQKVADNLIMAEKPKKKNKKDTKQGAVVKTDSISSADDHREVMTDTFFLNRKNVMLFPYNVHAEHNDGSPQIEKHNSSVLSKPLEENEYLEDPTENDLMGEISESSSIPDTFEHQFNNVVTNNTTNSSYQEYNSYFPGDSSFSHPGEVIASDEEAGLDTENDISSEVDDFTFQSSVGSTPLMANVPTIFNNIGENRHTVGTSQVWEELDGGEDLTSVGDMA